MNILAEFNYVNRTENLRSGDDGPLETRFKTAGELYRFCLKEYGRCIGAVRVDQANGLSIKVGWVFLKRMKYDDSNDTFICETWVTIHKAMPERHTTWHYAELED